MDKDLSSCSVCGRGRSQKDAHIQSEKEAASASQGRCQVSSHTSSQISRSTELPLLPLSTLHHSRSLVQHPSAPVGPFLLKFMKERSVPIHHVSCRIGPSACVHQTLPAIKESDKIHTSHCLSFVPTTFPFPFFL